MRYPHRNIMTRTLLLVGFFMVLFTACKRTVQYRHMCMSDPVVVDAAGQGISSKITDMWVYVNDQPAGVWEPGKRIPDRIR